MIAFCWTAFLAGPISIAWLIAHYGVNVAVQDEIRIGAFLVRNHGRLFPVAADLFAQHNESRKVFPRLIFFYLAGLTGWNVKYEMVVSLVLACGIAVVIGILARRTLPDRDAALVATALAVLMLFSPVQWWNWLFGIQIVVFIPLLMLVVALLAATSRLSLTSRMVIAAACCLIATYSYANGMLLWVLAGIALFARAEDRRPLFVAVWLALFGAAIGSYFFGYQRPPMSPAMVSPLSRPVELAEYVLAFIGHPLSWADSLTPSVVMGAAATAIFVTLAIRARRSALPWTLLGCYTIVSAGVTAAGRLGNGIQTAVEPRYATFAIPIWIAVVMLAAAAMPRGRAIGAILLLALHAMAVHAAWPPIRESYRDHLVARAATQFSSVLPDRSLLQRLVETDVDLAGTTVAALSRIGYVNPPIVESELVQSLRAAGDSKAQGVFEGVLRLSPRETVLYGWARLPDGRPADAVLIARVAADGDHVVALSERTIQRPDRPGMGWDLPLTRRLAIPGSEYHAYAYDTATRRAYSLAGSLRVARRE